jgi:hypothetical protein
MYDRRAASERRAWATCVRARSVRTLCNVFSALHGVYVRWIILRCGARLQY